LDRGDQCEIGETQNNRFNGFENRIAKIDPNTSEAKAETS